MKVKNILVACAVALPIGMISAEAAEQTVTAEAKVSKTTKLAITGMK